MTKESILVQLQSGGRGRDVDVTRRFRRLTRQRGWIGVADGSLSTTWSEFSSLEKLGRLRSNAGGLLALISTSATRPEARTATRRCSRGAPPLKFLNEAAIAASAPFTFSDLNIGWSSRLSSRIRRRNPVPKQRALEFIRKIAVKWSKGIHVNDPVQAVRNPRLCVTGAPAEAARPVVLQRRRRASGLCVGRRQRRKGQHE